MAITRVENPTLITSKEVDEQYDGRWVIFCQEDINSPGLVYAYSDSFDDTTKEEHKKDRKLLYDILIQELKGKGEMVHGCKERGRMNIHVEFH